MRERFYEPTDVNHMNKRILGLVLAASLLLTACADANLNTETSGENVSENSVSISQTEKTTYEENYGTEIDGEKTSVSGNDAEASTQDVSADDVSSGETAAKYVEPVYNVGNTNLKVPTYIECYDGLYFIVDCYNNQVIFSDSLDKELYEWQILDPDGGFNQPHTIACDGEVYMIDDTENNRIVAYTKHFNEDGTVYFSKIQEFEDMGERPHYIQYVADRKEFYAWSSESGQMWVFKRSKDKSKVFLDTSYTIPSLKDVYVRSFLIEEDKIYFVSGIRGEGCIYEVDFNTFEVLRKIPVAPEIGGMVQITKIQNYYYISVSTSLYGETELRDFIRTDSLDHLLVGQYESYYDYVTSGFAGTPYNLTEIDGEYYLTIHRDGWGSGVVRFDVVDDEVCGLKDYFY